MQEGGGADAGELLQVGEVRPGQIADRADAGGSELFGKGAADGEQVADGQRPELLRDLGGKKGYGPYRAFSKSLAILDRSLFSEMPTLTVKPSSEKMASLIWWATARGSG